MNKNNIFLFILLFAPSIAFAAAAPGRNVIQTSHSVNFDSKGFGEALGIALAKTQVGVNIDHKALGEALAKTQVGFNMDLKALGEALSQAKINIDPKTLKELLDSKEFKDTIANLKLIPANFTVNPIHFNLNQMPHVPVDLTIKLSSENGRRIAGTAAATMATASILCSGLNCINCPLLVGSCIAMDPERAQRAASKVFNEQNYDRLKICGFATKQVASAAVNNCLNKCRKPAIKPVQDEVKRD